MKKRKAKKMKTRAHRVLFCKDTPFRPKRVENKTAYRRRDRNNRQDE